MRDIFYSCFHYLNVNCPSRCIISLILPISMHNFFDFAYASSWDNSQNSVKYHASIKIHIIFDKYLIRARLKCLGGQICFTIIPDSLIDSIMETIDHIHCENISQRIIEQIFFSVTLCATPTYSKFCYSDQMTSSMLNAQISLLLHFWCKYGVWFGKVATWNTQF